MGVDAHPSTRVMAKVGRRGAGPAPGRRAASADEARYETPLGLGAFAPVLGPGSVIVIQTGRIPDAILKHSRAAGSLARVLEPGSRFQGELCATTLGVPEPICSTGD